MGSICSKKFPDRNEVIETPIKCCVKIPGNPGSFRDFSRDFKNLIPKYFTGVQIDLCKVLSSNFRINHLLLLGTDAQNNYEFGAEYSGGDECEGRNPKFYGNINSNGALSGGLDYQLGPFKAKTSFQFKSKICEKFEVSFDHLSCDGTASINVINPDVFEQNFQYSIQNYRRVTDQFLVGLELFGLYKCSASEFNYEGVLALKYLIDNGHVCGKFSYKEMRLNYYHVASDRLRFGVEFYRNFENNDTNAIFAYQFNVNEDKFLYKAHLSTNGILGGSIEKKLSEPDYTLVIGGQTNYFKEKFSVGIGLRIGDC